jgi:hypothetical protein
MSGYAEQLTLALAIKNRDRFIAAGWPVKCFYCDHYVPASEAVPSVNGLMVPAHFCPFTLDMLGLDESTPGRPMRDPPDRYKASVIVARMKATVMSWQTQFPKYCEVGECRISGNTPAADYCIAHDCFYCKAHEHQDCPL